MSDEATPVEPAKEKKSPGHKSVEWTAAKPVLYAGLGIAAAGVLLPLVPALAPLLAAAGGTAAMLGLGKELVQWSLFGVTGARVATKAVEAVTGAVKKGKREEE